MAEAHSRQVEGLGLGRQGRLAGRQKQKFSRKELLEARPRREQVRQIQAARVVEGQDDAWHGGSHIRPNLFSRLSIVEGRQRHLKPEALAAGANMEEHDAIRRLKRGELDGLETLVRLHQLRAVRAAYLIVRDAALAEDVVQDAFLRAASRIGQFDAGRPFGPWFHRIVVNLATRAAARAGRAVPLDRPAPGSALTLEDVLADRAPGPEALAEQAEQRERLWRALGRLAPEQRAAVVQRYYLGLSEAEMAAGEGLAPGTVKWRLHAARARLREWLRPWWAADGH
jgi:RNA polymerase sigma-70 factor (ECF subfamily)